MISFVTKRLDKTEVGATRVHRTAGARNRARWRWNAVFISTGLLIDFPRIANEPALIATAFASGAVIVCAELRDRRARTTAFRAGMREALLGLPSTLAHRAEIIDAVFATVFVTLVLQGLPLVAGDPAPLSTAARCEWRRRPAALSRDGGQ